MSVIDLTPEAVRERIAELSAPLREQYEAVEEAIAEKNAELLNLRELRTDIVRALSAVDPTFKTAKQTEIAARKNGGHKKNEVSAERVNIVLEFIREHVDEFPEGFTATSLERISPGTSQSTFAKALAVLHSRGDIRLDHRGRGGANFWKLVA